MYIFLIFLISVSNLAIAVNEKNESNDEEFHIGQTVLLDPKWAEGKNTYENCFEGKVITVDAKGIEVKWLRRAGRKKKNLIQDYYDPQYLSPLVQSYGNYEIGKLVHLKTHYHRESYRIEAVFKNGIIRIGNPHNYSLDYSSYWNVKLDKSLALEVDRLGQLRKNGKFRLQRQEYVALKLFEDGAVMYKGFLLDDWRYTNLNNIEIGPKPSKPRGPILRVPKIKDNTAESQTMVSLTTQTQDDTTISLMDRSELGNNSKK